MVILIQTTQELQDQRASEKGAIGFVPTMGNLHQGHISLLLQALSKYQTVYFSIFVNPKQFGPSEDFNRYPRTFGNDIKLIEEASQSFSNSKVIVYSPTNQAEVFPVCQNQTISVHGLNNDLEGKIRPGHFEGVATVVYRLFELIKPQEAYFGLKDYQQFLIIKQMTADLILPIKITGMPIVREPSGLALSSRNQYLNDEQKENSLILYRTLSAIKKIINGQKILISKAQDYIEEVLKDPHWNYLELRDSESFAKDISNSKNISILAVYQLGTTRLLDNMQVEVQ